MAFITGFEKSANAIHDLAGKAIEGIQSLVIPKLPPVKRNPKSMALADKVLGKLKGKA
jgi:hypothetical protein